MYVELVIRFRVPCCKASEWWRCSQTHLFWRGLFAILKETKETKVVISCQILYYYFVKGYFGGESGILLSSFQGHSTRSILTLHYLIALAHSKSGLEFPWDSHWYKFNALSPSVKRASSKLYGPQFCWLCG
jgi:hypothetical protein